MLVITLQSFLKVQKAEESKQEEGLPLHAGTTQAKF